MCVITLLLGTQVQAEEKQPVKVDEKQPLKTQKDKISYGIGMDMIKNFKQQGLEVDLEMVIRGMRDKSAGGKLLLSEEESRRILADYNRDLKLKQAKIKQETAEKNRKDGLEYLKANKVKEGVVTTASGLQYKILKAGNGKKPTEEDSITVRYRGTLLDGTVFDSTDRIGYPVTINLKDSVIAGWSEALKLMPAGSKWQVVVPSEIGYGETGAGRDIGPNATLIYEIELIAVNPQPVVNKKKDATK
jgi:FKBP-type peptidyl-prolyl cis-trans isomerase FklB